MIKQETLASSIKYCKDLMSSIKSPQEVSSANAAFYRDDGFGRPVSATFSLAANSNIKFLVTYSHPLAQSPYVSFQYDLLGVITPVAYEQYGTTTYNDPYITQSIIVIRTGASPTGTITINFGATASAPGTLSVITI